MQEKVTKEQYEFFRALYDEEERTGLQLEGRAKVYLAIISAFLGAVVLKAADAKSLSDTLHIRWTLLFFEAVPMTLALIPMFWALRIRDFEAVNDGPLLIGTYGDDWPTAEQFYEDRLADYAFASAVNRGINNETARLLQWSGWCLAAGIVYLLGIVVYAVGRS